MTTSNLPSIDIDATVYGPELMTDLRKIANRVRGAWWRHGVERFDFEEWRASLSNEHRAKMPARAVDRPLGEPLFAAVVYHHLVESFGWSEDTAYRYVLGRRMGVCPINGGSGSVSVG